MNRFKKILKYFNRLSFQSNKLSLIQKERISALKINGYVILDNFIKPPQLKELQSAYTYTLEKKCGFDLPCLAQNKVDDEKHAALINNYFLGNKLDYEKQGITFSRSDVRDYRTVISDYNPSTLTVYLTSLPQFYSLWLNEEILEIIEGYLGFKPYMVEAYIRRNFKAKYKVMNHFWHRDTNHRDYIVKVFIFLTDCSIRNGPHEYISGTIKDQRLSGKTYYSDNDINALYPENSKKRIQSVVKAGTVIIEDTRGLHRAIIPEEGYRDLGFATFLPKSFCSKEGPPLYMIDNNNYSAMSKRQRDYVPGSSIV